MWGMSFRDWAWASEQTRHWGDRHEGDGGKTLWKDNGIRSDDAIQGSRLQPIFQLRHRRHVAGQADFRKSFLEGRKEIESLELL